MLFAAGFGTRMRPLTDYMPKPMIPVSGRCLIDYAIDIATGVSPENIVANLHYMPRQLAAHLTPRGVQTIVEKPDILDTGGGLRNALPLLGSGPVMTLNTDAVWTGPNPLSALLRAWDPHQMDGLLMCVPPARAVGRLGAGDFVPDNAGRLSRGPGDIYGGAQIIKTELLHEITDSVFSLNRVWDMMLTHGRLFGIHHTGQWCDVGHPEGIGLAETMLSRANV
ncbi:nucleotidyltransferase family protein [uncultured Roseobacter sp.]|uniref:nucleotidyltransferase family protein n=1 Tax=uncultured Roseobacter sp. TaxID=114847 RepID=UPI002609EE59|nr:nucleotidyltransferase family protein [uncultured Roseobacter sp.]